MNSLRIVLHVVLVTAVAGLGHAQDSPKNSSSTTKQKGGFSPDRVILKVGDVSVTQSEFEATIGQIEPQADPDNADPDAKDRRRYGDDYASVLMLSQQAVASHLDASPEIRRQLAIDRLQILSDAQFASLMHQAKPGAEEVNRYYASHLADFDRLKIRRLFIWKVGAGTANTNGLPPAEARARADAILQTAASGGDSEKLLDAFKGSAEGMLDAEPITVTRGALAAKLEKVAFGLEKGQWAEGEDTPDKLMLLQLVERDRRPMEEVSSLIEQRMQGEKMQVRLDELKKRSGIWMDESYFGSAVAEVPGEQRPVSKPPSKPRKSEEKRGENQ